MAELSRRKFLGRVGGCAGYFAAAQAFAPLTAGYAYAASSCTAQNKVLVHLFLDGGMDSANFLVPRNIQAYHDKRPNIAISNSLAIDSKYGLHPALTNLQAYVQQGTAAVINKVGYPQPTRSHEDSKAVYSRAVRSNGITQTGWAGRFGDAYCVGNPNVTSVFSFRGAVQDVRAQSFVATTAGSLGSYGYQNDSDSNDSRYRRLIMASDRTLDPIANEQMKNVNGAWNVIDNAVTTVQAVNQQTNTTTYSNDNLSQRFKDAAKLIKSQENPSIILMGQGGYDTHGDELLAQQGLFTNLNNALGSFMTDMTNIGRLNDVVVVIFTEFGRNSFENSTKGTDHGHGTVGVVLGGGVHGGIHGPDYTEADFANREYLPGDVDFREVLSELMGQHMGVDPAPLFPEAFQRTGINVFGS